MEKIVLSPLVEDDLEFLLEVRNDESTRNQLKDNTIYSLEECKEWFKNLDSYWWIVCKKETLERVGYFRTKGNVIGCDIHPNHRRKGYARAAYKEYLDRTLRSKLELDVFEDNHAKKLYEDLGFKETGEVEFIRGRKYLKMVYENRN